MNRTYLKSLITLTAILLLGCDSNEEAITKQFTFTFANSTEEWSAFFSDYPPGMESFYELEFERATLPPPLDTSAPSLKISGNNHSDDLLSLICRKIEGLTPNHNYKVNFSIDLASIVAKESPGIGGSPDLALGAGAIPYAPESIVKNESTIHEIYRPNFTSGLQSHVSNDVLRVLGGIGVTEQTTEYTLINRNNASFPISIRSNDRGEIWLLIGTDSGFEGITTLYYKSIDVKIM